MDCVVVETVRNPSSKPESRAVLTRPGTRFGRLVVERRDALGYVVMRCDCGETVALTGRQVQAGKRYQCDSCDTWDQKPLIRKYLGDEVYKNIRSRGDGARRRCEDPSTKGFKDYGARGIMFAYEDVDHYTLHIGMLAQIQGLDNHVDRMNNDGPYSPDNVRLVPVKINMRNRRNTIFIEGRPLWEIAEQNGIDPLRDKTKYSGIIQRLKYINATGSSTIDDAIRIMNEFKLKTPNVNLRKKSPYRKLKLNGVSLAKYLSSMGFAGNRAIYDAAKSLFRSGKIPSEDEIRDYVTLYAIKNNIRGV